MDANLAATHIGSTLLVVSGIQWLKKLKAVPFIQAGSKVVSRLASLIAAFAIEVGIHYTWNSQAGSLVITGINLSAIAIGTFHVITQFLYQETGYQALQGIQAMQGILNFLQSAAPTVPVSPTPEPVTQSSAPAPINPPIK